MPLRGRTPQHDNASVHTAATTVNFLTYSGVFLLDQHLLERHGDAAISTVWHVLERHSLEWPFHCKLAACAKLGAMDGASWHVWGLCRGRQGNGCGHKNYVGCANMFCMTCWSILLFSFTVFLNFYKCWFIFMLCIMCMFDCVCCMCACIQCGRLVVKIRNIFHR